MSSQFEPRSVAGQGKKIQPLQTLNRTLYSLVLLSFLLPFATVRGCSTGEVRTFRLMVVFGSVLPGVLFLCLAITPLVTGRIEVRATAIDIEEIEQVGFPQADHLEIENGNLVFRDAQLWLSGRGNRRKLLKLTAPVVSDAQLKAWQADRGPGVPLDLSRLRVVAAFSGEQVAVLWPEVLQRALAEEPLDLQPVKMNLIGDTVVAKGQLSLPTFPNRRYVDLDWKKVRHLRHGAHHHSLGRFSKNLLIGLALIGLSYLVFRYHRRHPTRPSYGGVDLTPILDDALDA
jgi:hypothetical protein